MKKTISFTLCTLLLAVAGSSFGAIHVQCQQVKGKCVAPTPPAPPALPALPVPPTPPAPPAPPPPPPIPEVPEAAHAACASKSAGSTLTWTIRKGETMTGVCERENGKMVFQLRRYDLDD